MQALRAGQVRKWGTQSALFLGVQVKGQQATKDYGEKRKSGGQADRQDHSSALAP